MSARLIPGCVMPFPDAAARRPYQKLRLAKVAPADRVVDEATVRNVAQIEDPVRRIGTDVKAGPIRRSRIREIVGPRTITDRFGFVDRSADEGAGVRADESANSRSLGVTGGRRPQNRARGSTPSSTLARRRFAGSETERDK